MGKWIGSKNETVLNDWHKLILVPFIAPSPVETQYDNMRFIGGHQMI